MDIKGNSVDVKGNIVDWTLRAIVWTVSKPLVRPLATGEFDSPRNVSCV